MPTCRRLCLTALVVGNTAIIGCASITASDPTEDDGGLSGTIAYPFVDETNPLGKNGPEEKFVIRSAVGDREYAIEIPGGARDFDVQVPLADLGEATGEGGLSGRRTPKNLPSPVTTDQEMKSTLPSLDRNRPTDTALLDGAFGAAPAKGPAQAPSYTLGVARVNDYFKNHDYEYCLIELNSLLAFYPTSPKLLKMKGTVLLRMRNPALAELAWIKALELAPSDRALRHALERLQKRGRQATEQSAQEKIPQPVFTQPVAKEPALSH